MLSTRFAPSPTGYLHIGGLRTALYSYLWARKNQGSFKLRIEDTDKDRNNDLALKAIIEAFAWVGLEYDDEVVYQSKRLEIYQKYIKQLLDDGKAYYCYMTKEELDELRAKQKENKQTPRYDGRYRDFTGIPPKGVEPVVRIKTPQEGEISFVDLVKGQMTFQKKDIDDFIIARSSGIPTYNFVVTVDDALMEITDVMRGDDHLSNTPKQIVIYEALGFKVPKFCHIPMINNPQGKKLSKRDGAMDVMEYKRQGFLPHALLNFLLRLGWSHGDQEIFSKEEMLDFFDPKDINKSASAYNSEKLLWLNAHYIKNTPNEKLIKLLEDFSCDISKHNKKEVLLDLCKPRANTLVELKDAINLILDTPKEFDKKGVRKFIKNNIQDTLKIYIKTLEKEEKNLKIASDYEKVTIPFMEEHELKMPHLFQPLRIALTGGIKAPSVYDIMSVLGFDECKKRINFALENDFFINEE